MLNWAAWKLGGGSFFPPVTSAYDLEARGRHEETSVELINGEAIDVERGMATLADELKLVVAEYWLRRGTVRQKLKSCRCSSRTFYRRLDQAHRQIHEYIGALRGRREALELSRARIANGGQTPLPR